MVLLGMVPVLAQTPPITSRFSTRATRLPTLAPWMAARCPAGPEPMTMRSKLCMEPVRVGWGLTARGESSTARGKPTIGVGGHRCNERRFVEFHHLDPYALGGEATVDGIELRCRRHNDYERRLYFGKRRTRPSASSQTSGRGFDPGRRAARP